MKKVIGSILVILGIILGGYLVLYVGLYGGICQIIDGINPVIAKDIALGIIRILFCELGAIPGIILGYIGIALLYK